MIRRDFLKTAAGTAAALGTGSPSAAAAETEAPTYRAGVIGLGWTGVLYDLAGRGGLHRQGTHWDPAYDMEGDRPTPGEIDVHRKFYHHDHPGNEGLPISYSEALHSRPEVELVAGAERDRKRLAIFGERYGIEALYTDAIEMLRHERLDIVAVCTNVKGRSYLTCAAVEHGAKAVITEKPMVFTLEEADRMVQACADRGVPLVAGAITTVHPSFEKAKQMVLDGTIGEVVSIEAGFYLSQHQNWTYFIDSPPAWVSGIGDLPRLDNGSDEFRGQGMMVTRKGQVVHFRPGGPMIRISGSKGEISFDRRGRGWRIWRGRQVSGRPDAASRSPLARSQVRRFLWGRQLPRRRPEMPGRRPGRTQELGPARGSGHRGGDCPQIVLGSRRGAGGTSPGRPVSGPELRLVPLRKPGTRE